MDLYNQLKDKHKRFIYHDYFIEEDGFSFHFSLDSIDFRPKWTHSLPVDMIDKNLYSYLIFNLGMVELISYWKCACPQAVEIRCGGLDAFQINWWKKLYRKGLGEFFYRNGITPQEDFIILEAETITKPFFLHNKKYEGCLIPVGGGKDSVVTLELLGVNNNLCYMINPRKAAFDTAKLAGFSKEKIITAHRTIDKQLLKLNNDGYLNGHTPFSAIIAFSGYLFAVLAGKKFIALSNESSANEGNIAGTDINHQYSKSTEFEGDFRKYIQHSFGEYPEYFSLLRPWSEWQITRKFVSFDKYINAFQSCNVGTKTDTWCGKCAKCLYVYIMLAAFINDEKLSEIFGGNMLDNAEFSDIFNGLVYENAEKPFECVGTKEEINYALKMAYIIRKGENYIPLLLNNYIGDKEILINDAPNNYFDENNYVPEEFIHLLRG